MFNLIRNTYNSLYFRLYRKLSTVISTIYFTINGIEYSSVTCIGIPLLDIHHMGKCKFGSGLSLVSKDRFATLGRNNRCKIVVYPNAVLSIGDKVGISNTTIVATSSISIGNNIMIGGGVTIVDSDFHSLNPIHWHTTLDAPNMKSSAVTIEDNVFIGMNTIILKGVNIGSNVVIAAGSLVSKDIPANQTWGGNPAKFIKFNI